MNKCYNERGKTIQEILCQFFNRINECIDNVNEYTVIVEELKGWIESTGLSNEVEKVLNLWLENGTINSKIFQIFQLVNDEVEKARKGLPTLGDKISQIDIKISGNTDEIVGARKGLSSLGDKIGDIDSKINQIIEQGSTTEAVNRVVGEKIDQAIREGSIASMVIGDNSITDTKYKDGSIKGTKLDTQYSYKGFKYGSGTDINNIVDSGVYLINSDVKNLPIASDFVLEVIKYDTTKIIQKLYNTKNQTLWYIRHATIPTLTSTTFTNVTELLNKPIEEFEKAYLNKENIINNDKIKYSAFINPNGGGEVSNSDYRSVIEYLPVASTNFIGVFNQGGGLTTNNAVIGAYYDNNKGFIQQLYYSGDTRINCTLEKNGFIKLTPPPNAKFVRFSINDTAVGMERKKLMFTHLVNSTTFVDGNAINNRKLQTKKLLENKIIVNFGDSIFGNDPRGDKSISNLISNKTGALVYNSGFGGCKMSKHSTGWDNCSMYRLSDFIKNKQLNDLNDKINIGWSGMPGYFTNVAYMLAKDIDFNKVDLITISYGTNDYRDGAKLDNPLDPNDIKTVCGALRYSCKQIWSAYPHIKIIVTPPIFRYFGDIAESSDTKNWGGGTLIDYMNGIKKVCNELKIPFLNLYEELGINTLNMGYYFPGDDFTHPNEKGREVISSLIADKIISILR